MINNAIQEYEELNMKSEAAALKLYFWDEHWTVKTKVPVKIENVGWKVQLFRKNREGSYGFVP